MRLFSVSESLTAFTSKPAILRAEDSTFASKTSNFRVTPECGPAKLLLLSMSWFNVSILPSRELSNQDDNLNLPHNLFFTYLLPYKQ